MAPTASLCLPPARAPARTPVASPSQTRLPCLALPARPALRSAGKEGVEAAYEQSAEFHEKWKVKSREMLARAEWRRRKLTKRVRPSTWSLFFVGVFSSL